MRFRLVLAAAAASGCGVLAVTLAAQTQDPGVLTALLTEVRGLRQAIEQMTAAGPRVQLALGRLQLQEQRLNTMLRRLEGVRDNLAGAGRSSTEIQHQIVRMQEDLKSADARGREGDVSALTFEVGELKRRLAASQEEAQRWQAAEAQLQQQIAGEQARWSDINRTLEDLERALAKR